MAKRIKLEIEIESESWAAILEILREETEHLYARGPYYNISGGGHDDHRRIKVTLPEFQKAT